MNASLTRVFCFVQLLEAEGMARGEAEARIQQLSSDVHAVLGKSLTRSCNAGPSSRGQRLIRQPNLNVLHVPCVRLIGCLQQPKPQRLVRQRRV